MCAIKKHFIFWKILAILDFLTFGGIPQRTGFGCISMSNFRWFAWGAGCLENKYFSRLQFFVSAGFVLNPAVCTYHTCMNECHACTGVHTCTYMYIYLLIKRKHKNKCGEC